jgi:hypothetical protein
VQKQNSNSEERRKPTDVYLPVAFTQDFDDTSLYQVRILCKIFLQYISGNYDRPKTNGNVEYFKYLGSMLTNDGRCTCEIKSRIAMAKAAFNKKTLFTSTLDLNLKKKLVKCYIWSTAFYGAETWTLRAAD